MNKVYYILFLAMLVCIGCEWRLTSADADDAEGASSVVRYDRVESLYLTTGDFSALQQLNTVYPQQTRTLIEDVLKIGRVNDPEINQKFLHYYQDTTLQSLIAEVEEQYADMGDVNRELHDSFERLRQMVPNLQVPLVYAQIGSLDQSIVVGDGMLGISLDKYLGTDFPLYLRESYGYTERQRQMMTREYIVPDCLSFYLLSLYPLAAEHEADAQKRLAHISKIQWVVNRVMGRTVFASDGVSRVGSYMKRRPKTSVEQLLTSTEI